MKATIDEVRIAKEEAEAKINSILAAFIKDFELTNISLITESSRIYDESGRRAISVKIKTQIEVKI
jgi:hypothetical protein